MRRRLWWQIIVLDVMHCEDRGTHPIISSQMYDTKLPMDINDESLSPTTSQIVPEVGGSEMTHSLVGFEAARSIQEVFALSSRNQKTPFSSHEYEQVVRNCCQRLAACTARCDVTLPVHWAALTVSRLCMLRLWLLLYRPLNTRRQVTKTRASRENILGSAVSIVEMSQLLTQSPHSNRWAWMGRNWVGWYPIAIILAELCHQTRGPLVERAWNIVDTVYEASSNLVADSKKGALWRPITKLLEKARKARLQDKRPDILGWDAPNSRLISAQPGNIEWSWLHEESIAMALGNRDTLESSFANKHPQGMQEDFALDSVYPDTNVVDIPDSTNWDDWDSLIQSTWASEPQLHQENGGMLW